MAVTNPPTITALPTAPDRSDRATFSARATAMFAALKNVFVGEVGAVATNVFNNATDAATSASAASTAASTATTQASNASSSASSASTSASTATTKAAEAAASALAAAAGAPGLVFLGTSSPAAVAAVAFTGLSSAYEHHIIELINVVPATDQDALWLRTSTNNGSSYDSASGDYDWILSRSASGTNTVTNGGSNATRVSLTTGTVSNSAAWGGVSGFIRIYNVAGTSHHKRIVWELSTATGTSNGNLSVNVGAASRASTADVDAVQLLFSTGNITSGIVKLYGVKKS